MHLRDPTVFERERTMIESQVHHMVGMVDDLLDVSRIARGKVTLARAPVRIADVVAHSLETAEPLLVDRRQTIDKQIADDVVIEGDERRLTQILTNLLTNAAKYSPPGRTIHLTARSADDNAVIRVRDEGFGIDKVLLPRIFDTFTQDARSVARSRGGLGLGLAIVRNLVGMHGGSVEARSEGRDRGSEFIVRLPLARDTANPTPDNTIEENTKRADEVQPAIKVLIVDDYAAAADSLAELLELSGLRTRIARDGPAAIEAAAEFHPGIALIDIGLPVMNGYEVARRLREIPEIGHPHLVAVTGYGQERDRKLAKEAGFDEHLAKPIDAERIDSLIRDHAANTGTERWP
jgi:CheY-like chemotaxis protein/anti-sigma regulatory factor (Ser/Thr protein kinase)